MKTLFLSLSLLLGAIAPGIAQFTNNTPMKLRWEDTNGTNTTIRVHTSFDVSVPLTNWLVLHQRTGGTVSNVQPVLVSPPKQFFVVSASNEWGIVFSAVCATEPPRAPANLWLSRE